MYSILHHQNLTSSRLIYRFINFLIKKGKKSKAKNIFFNSLKKISSLHEKRIETRFNRTPLPGFADETSKTMLVVSAEPNNLRSLSEPKVRSTLVGSKVGIISNVHESRMLFETLSLRIFEKAINNVQPLFEVKKVRIAGSTYQVPANLTQKQQENKAINWLIQSSKERKRKNPSQNFDVCLALEIYDAFLKQGTARQKRTDLHKLAEANRAFSHFRWW